MHDLASALHGALAGSPACLVRVPLGWNGADLEAGHPLDYLGLDGGAGIGSGPGMAVGAALALDGSGRLPVAVLGDGDFLMGGTAIWTAARYRLPLLIVVANNSSFHNDVVHQERMARQRHRPTGNSWIGQAISDPDPDMASFARSLGFHAVGQVNDRSALPSALAAAVAAARSGQCVLVDVRVRPDSVGRPVLQEITVGVVAPAYVNIPLWVAQERGFLDRRGLRATERILGTTDGVTSALRRGEVDIALTAPEGSIADAVAGGSLRVVAGLIDRPPLSMIALPRHRTFGDLRGGRIGTSSLTEGTRHVAQRMLAAHGLTYPGDYDFALEGSHVERWKALQAGTIDAALQMIPYDYLAADAGFTEPRAGDRGIRPERRLRQPLDAAEPGSFLPAGARRSGGMVPRQHRGVGGYRRGTHVGRAALRAARLRGAGCRRGHPAGPAVRARRPRGGPRGDAVERPDPAGRAGPDRRRRRLLVPGMSTAARPASSGSYDVAVVGGGPVGMWLAAELHRGGVRPVVLERHAKRPAHSKALTIYPRTMEQFAMRGIADRWLAEGTPVPSTHFAILRNRLDMSFLDTRYPYTLFLPQRRTEELLEEHLTELGVPYLTEHAVTGLRQDETGVDLDVDSLSGPYEFPRRLRRGL